MPNGNRPFIITPMPWTVVDPFMSFWPYDYTHKFTVSFFIVLRKLSIVKKQDEQELANAAAYEAQKRQNSVVDWQTGTYSTTIISVTQPAYKPRLSKKAIKQIGKADQTYNPREKYKTLMKGKTYSKGKR